MKRTLIFSSLALILSHSVAHAEILEDIWNKYSPEISKKETIEDVWTRYNISKTNEDIQVHTPGRLIGNVTLEQKKLFDEAWKFRHATYELYFASSTQLGESVYDLALFTKDIDKTLPKEKFLKGVLGFHYGQKQVSDWANSLWNKNHNKNDYPYLIQLFIEDKVLFLTEEGFQASEKLHHILGASEGKKRTFFATLQHERLHIFWDEDNNFREEQIKAWKNLSEEEKAQVRKDLHRYAQSNEQQLIEEWAVYKAEKNLNIL